MNSDIEQFKELLNESEQQYFESLAPSYQKIFVNHVFSAKTEKTRLKNIDEVKEAFELKCKNIFEYKKKKNPIKVTNNDATDKEKIVEYFDKIEDTTNRDIASIFYQDIIKLDNNLIPIYLYNNPMIKYNVTFICGFTVAKNHMTLAFETNILNDFKEKILDSGYTLNKKTFIVNYNQTINMDLIKEMVNASIELKKDCRTFWLK